MAKVTELSNKAKATLWFSDSKRHTLSVLQALWNAEGGGHRFVGENAKRSRVEDKKRGMREQFRKGGSHPREGPHSRLHSQQV